MIDCNNFYASCERVFDPRLIGKPIVILSNNDGCVIARSQEAKDVGVEMGAPEFKYRNHFKENGVVVRSSNYALYGDMSHRVMETLRYLTHDIEVYSIDEAFAELSTNGIWQINSRNHFEMDRIACFGGNCINKNIGKSGESHC